MKQIGSIIYLIFCVMTSMIGYHMHHSIFYAIINWFFAPLAWVYWIITHSVNLTIIKETFEFFIK
jgi:hypothetical protein